MCVCACVVRDDKACDVSAVSELRTDDRHIGHHRSNPLSRICDPTSYAERYTPMMELQHLQRSTGADVIAAPHQLKQRETVALYGHQGEQTLF